MSSKRKPATKSAGPSPPDPPRPDTELNGERLVRDVVVVAASAGGFQLIMSMAAALEPGLPAGVVVVLHRGPTPAGSLLELVQSRCRMRVIEPQRGELFTHGTLYLAPPDQHLIFRHKSLWPSHGPKEHFTRPAANPLFRSAAAEYGPRVLGVVLSGGDSDGTSGCQAILAAGGITLAQDPGEALHPSMPRSTIQSDAVTAVLSMDGILEAIHALAEGRSIRCFA
jgi:two-component system, chemotaxis family, protein-glutamate methylesterase/glutaminase